MQGTPSWFTSLEQEQHKDQTQRNAMKCRMVEAQIKCRVQVWCSNADPGCSYERLEELEVTPEDEENLHAGGRTLLDRGTISSEDDEDQLKNGFKQEEKKRALNGSKKQPAREKDQLRANQNGENLSSWLKTNQPDSISADAIKSTSKVI
ncbi:hypothetical protein F511_05402 [Dorcoceras hygrometricum]|uniref:Uncharacterized protein n=1 Tax=Dorcoceras hygrometricum TaxID=472368 RepID=A0A2Z7BIM8_9LAMI|nr:hypothetical protein F511_05402 [Dorcoceras hygrometricum]